MNTTMPQQTPAARDTTAALRGIAILIVLLSHFLTNFVVSHDRFGHAGNAAVALFFIASGYGNAWSLTKRHAGGCFCLRDFYRDRFFRLYPLYWLALGCIWASTKAAPDVWAISGVKTPYWFVGAIIQCAAVAPFLYDILRRVGPWRFSLGLFGLLAAATAAAAWLPEDIRAIVFSNILTYRNIVFGHIGFFGIGLVLAFLPFAGSKARPATTSRRAKALGLLALAGLAPGLVVLGEPKAPLAASLAGLGLAALCTAFTVLFLSGRARLPLARAVAFLGRNSYALYLFEPSYFWAMASLGFNPWTTTGRFWCVLAMPVFALFCQTAESLVGWLSRRPIFRFKAGSCPAVPTSRS
ncbi:MAG: putative acyltransferase [Solidesulfovibrio magneticus str. Maddingley MBC34]|uniref:Putative acyltransferase n=1 Tax=Solidesulfovibrio magneticus str. Maddingley MBC34 TaxID=1206767 RepID=K6GHL1_9BACT|nr:MAG: putative acyltransferase [Solidesulfovibrio magneticus str. Maddingley MBC34]